jgi:hypothetical protein
MSKQSFKNHDIHLTHTFDQAVKYLQDKDGEKDLKTAEGTPFTAKVGIATKSKDHPHETFIGFYQNFKHYGRCYKTDWGKYLNSSKTIIGTYCQALDSDF